MAPYGGFRCCRKGAGPADDPDDLVGWSSTHIDVEDRSVREICLVRVGPEDGLDHDCVVALDNVFTIPGNLLGRTGGYLSSEQEVQLARAVVLAHHLELPLLE